MTNSSPFTSIMITGIAVVISLTRPAAALTTRKVRDTGNFDPSHSPAIPAKNCALQPWITQLHEMLYYFGCTARLSLRGSRRLFGFDGVVIT